MGHHEETSGSPELISALCRTLVTLARREDDVAANGASRTPYWSPTPSSVDAHRAAARILRDEIQRLEFQARALRLAS